MENTKKLTKKDYFGVIRGIIEASDVENKEEVLKFIDHETDLLSKRVKAETATQKENKVLVEELYDALKEIATAVTITELQAANEKFGGMSNQKVSALMKKLVDANRVVKTQDKKRSYFSIAD